LRSVKVFDDIAFVRRKWNGLDRIKVKFIQLPKDPINGAAAAAEKS